MNSCKHILFHILLGTSWNVFKDPWGSLDPTLKAMDTEYVTRAGVNESGAQGKHLALLFTLSLSGNVDIGSGRRCTQNIFFLSKTINYEQ